MLERIAKLLAKAENAATQEEAEVYFAKAQQLATVHQISLAEAHLAKGKSTSVLTQRAITIGQRGRQANAHLLLLFVDIAHQNDVRCILAHNSTWVRAYGFSDDIDTVELMWSKIAPTMVRLGEDFLDEGTWRTETTYRAKKVRNTYRLGDSEWSEVEEEWDYWPVTKQSARASFYEGFRAAITSRLGDMRARTIAEADPVQSQESGETTTAALVLSKKAESVGTYYAANSNAKGTYRGGQGHHYSYSSATAGRQAGQSVSLSNHAGVGGKRGSISA